MPPSGSNMPEHAIAVVGLAGRFPGARSVDEFWANVRDGRETITRFSEEELLAAGVDRELLDRPDYVRARPVIDDVEWFDAAYFGISAREAELTDPQHRLLLECALHALEDAGYAPGSIRANVGVFVGSTPSSYVFYHLAGHDLASIGSTQLSIGNSPDALATRLAYKLDLKGPAYTVQSACSTSLLAVHLACQTLLNFECDVAIAGGVSLMLPLRSGYVYQDEGIESPDGHCRPFDAQARGTVFGSGVGVVVLKRLEAALADGDTIHAIVRGSAVNNDGALKAGFTAPSVSGQAAVIAEALSNADVEAESIGYLETHGTGTSLGDPIEIAALTRAFREQTPRTQFCALGAVKANIGHLDAAAGIAGFLKTVCVLREKTLPPLLHFSTPNPAIDFAGSPFFVDTSTRPWTDGDGPRRAGVSAFGIGGTNVHVVLEEAPPVAASGPSREWQVLPVSARSAEALETAVVALVDHLDEQDAPPPLADVAYTLQVGRRAHDHRRAAVCRSVDDAIDRLDPPGDPDLAAGVVAGPEHPVVFMFPGLGVQAPGMAAELYQAEPAFRRALDAACDALAPHLPIDPRDALTSPSSSRTAALMARIDVAEPALFALEYALADLLGSWGVRPDVLIGHSVGEYAAACVAGVFSLADAARLVAARATLLEALPPGVMLAVPLAPDAVRELIAPPVALAFVNTSSSCVVAGPPDAMTTLESRLSRQGVATRRLDIPRALQSPMVDAAAEALERMAATVERRLPERVVVSTVTGRSASDDLADPRYWGRQLRQTVYFADGIRDLLKDASRAFVEVGPGMTLTTLARQNLERGRRPVIVNAMADPRERKPAMAQLLTVLARLWVTGVSVDWEALHAGARRRRVPLPGYPFERRKYWIEPAVPEARAASTKPRRAHLDDFCSVPGWKQVPRRRPAAMPAEGGRWLVFGDGDLGDGLKAAGIDAVVATPADVYGDDRRVPRTAMPPGLTRVLDAWEPRDAPPEVVVFAWGLRDTGAAETDTDDRRFYDLLFLAQAMSQAGWCERGVTLAVITCEAQAVDGRERIDPSRALVLGPALVIGHEWPAVACVAIDVGADDLADPVVLARHVRREVQASACTVQGSAGPVQSEARERFVALRGSQRFVRAYEPMPLQAVEGSHPRLRPQGVYLVTGGFGGVGATLAEALATDLQARLVLVGRRPLPDRAGWDDWLTNHREDDETSRRIALVRRLEAAGAEVLAAHADVASPAEMAAVIAAARARFGRIEGVVHAAGVPGGGIIPLKTRAGADMVLRPKVQGTSVLAAALRDEPPDFVLLCSSLASLAGNAGQVDYCAANAFLDAWALGARRDAGAPHVVSVNWDAWRDVGMAVTTTTPASWQGARERQLKDALSPAEGAEIVRRVLAQDWPQVLVSTVPVAERLRREPVRAAANGEAGRTRHPRPALQTAFVEPRTGVEKDVAAAWEEALGLAPIGLDDNFFDLGGDSLTALRLIARLQADRGLACSITDFYAAPTIRLLVARLPAPGSDLQQAAASIPA